MSRPAIAQQPARVVPEIFTHVDAIVTPTVAVTAFAAGELGVDEVDGIAVDRHLGWSPFSWPINLTGLPRHDFLRLRLRTASDRTSDHCALARRGVDCADRRAFERARPWSQFRPRMS